MNTVSERIRYVIKHDQRDEADIWRNAGIKYTTWRDIINGTTEQPRKLFEIAQALNVSLAWLSHGLGRMRPESSELSPGPEIRGTVPLLSWVQAGPYTAAEDPADVSACEQIPTTGRVGRRTFALRVENTSMTPEFQPGCIIIVEPDLEPRPGDYVVVANGAAEATFKQLVQDGPHWLLRPLNPQFQVQPMPEHGRIVGVVVAMEKRFR